MKNLTLYHYSNADFKQIISPKYFGAHSYTDNSVTISTTKKAFFYLIKGERERFFTSARYLYIAEIKASALYDIYKDNKGYIKKLIKKNILLSVNDIYNFLKAKGYKGAIGHNGYKCAILFEAVKIKEREALIF